MSDKIFNLKEISGIEFNKEKSVKKELLEESSDYRLYSNIYPIKFNKDIIIYEYPFEIETKDYEENIVLKILRQASKEIFNLYGYYYRSGDSIYAIKNVKEDKEFNVNIIDKGKLQYLLKIKSYKRFSKITKGQKYNFSEIDEKIIFLIIRGILSTSPNVHFDRDNLYLENKKKEIIGRNDNKYYVHDGFKISIQQTDYGICLIIGVKNKIKGQFTVYDLLNNQKIPIQQLIGRRFIPFEGSRHQQIYDIDKNRNPINTTRNFNGETLTYYDYYEKIGKKIKHKNQPLIIVKSGQSKEKLKYYIPELCTLIGINEDDSKSFNFMSQVIEKTRLNPYNKIKQIEECLNLFVDTTESKKYHSIVEDDKKNKLENLNTILDDELNTSKKKSLYYGIEIEKLKDPIKPYYVKQPTFYSGKKKLTIKDLSKIVHVSRDCLNTDEWICLYTKKVGKASYKLLEGLIECSKGYGINFEDNDNNWIPMDFNEDWIQRVNEELKYRKNCKFVIFLLDKETNYLYTELKKHSLCDNGYISQVIRGDNIYKLLKNKRKLYNYFSKILLQINNKLGGCNYFLNTDKYIDERKIMLIGVDSNHIWGKVSDQRTGIAMVSTKDSKFSKFFSRQEILRPDEKYASESRRAIHALLKMHMQNM